jgi:predicted nucleic acid-binding protein
LDTNVISEIRKPSANANVRGWFESVVKTDLYLSVLVLGEVRRGAELLRRRDPYQAIVYENWLATLRQDYSDRIVPITPDIAEQWGRLNVPTTISTMDGLMAATAIVEGLTFVTRNTADVARTGVATLNPFLPL